MSPRAALSLHPSVATPMQTAASLVSQLFFFPAPIRSQDLGSGEGHSNTWRGLIPRRGALTVTKSRRDIGEPMDYLHTIAML